MRLSDLYPKLTTPERESLAKAAGMDAGYLYQLATRWRGKKPSLKKIQMLAGADRRLTLRDLVAEFLEPAADQKAEAGHA